MEGAEIEARLRSEYRNDRTEYGRDSFFRSGAQIGQVIRVKKDSKTEWGETDEIVGLLQDFFPNGNGIVMEEPDGGSAYISFTVIEEVSVSDEQWDELMEEAKPLRTARAANIALQTKLEGLRETYHRDKADYGLGCLLLSGSAVGEIIVVEKEIDKNGHDTKTVEGELIETNTNGIILRRPQRGNSFIPFGSISRVTRTNQRWMEMVSKMYPPPGSEAARLRALYLADRTEWGRNAFLESNARKGHVIRVEKESNTDGNVHTVTGTLLAVLYNEEKSGIKVRRSDGNTFFILFSLIHRVTLIEGHSSALV
ncbi:MAG: hypothetical protein JO026_01155 [Patescibacteria group bacterium]|nr:hypothetical protein [Patescibacteria group bacterium]